MSDFSLSKHDNGLLYRMTTVSCLMRRHRLIESQFDIMAAVSLVKDTKNQLDVLNQDHLACNQSLSFMVTVKVEQLVWVKQNSFA